MKRLLNLLLVLLVLVADAQAGTLRRCKELESKTNQASSANGSVIEFEPVNYQALSLVATANNVSGSSPTLDLKVQSCRTTAASSCRDLQSFDQCTTGSCWTVGSQVVDMNQATVNWFKYMRVVATLGGSSPVYTYTVEVCHDGK